MQFVKLHQHDIQVSQADHQWEITGSIKPAVNWLLTVIACSGVSGFFFTGITKLALGTTGKCIFLLLFVALGIKHMLMLLKWHPQLSIAKKIVYTLLVGFFIVPVLYVLFSIQEMHTSLLPIAAGAAFILPFMIQACWFYFSGIQSEQATWYMPEDMEPETRMSLLLLNSIPFSIHITTSEKDNSYTNIPVTANPKLQVDVIFCRFLHHQQQRVHNTRQTGWRFYAKRWYGVRPLDPGASLIDNGIQPNDILIAERASAN